MAVHHTVWPEAQLVYTSIAKVANTSIKTALLHTFMPDVPRRAPHGAHIPYLGVHVKRIRHDYPAFCHFAVVRNPYDRLVSFWADKIDGPTELIPQLGRLGMHKGMSFADTVRIVAATEDAESNGHFRSQNWLISDGRGRLRPDLLLRFERLNEDWDLLCWLVAQRTGAHVKPLTRRRVSEHRHFTDYYDDELWALATERYRTDLELLQYPVERTGPTIEPDADVDRALAEIVNGHPGVAVLDLTQPTLQRLDLVEATGGHLLGSATASPYGHLVATDALRHDRIPQAAFDVVVVRRGDLGVGSEHHHLAAGFRADGRIVVTAGDDLTAMVQRRTGNLVFRLRRKARRIAARVRSGVRSAVRKVRSAGSRRSRPSPAG